MKATTVRMNDDLMLRVDGIAKSLNRPRSWIITQALDHFVKYEEWYIQEIKDALDEVKSGAVATEDEVARTFKNWGVNAN